MACGSSDASNQQTENGESGAGGGSKSPERSHGCEDEHVHGSETSGAAAALETMKAKYVALLEAKIATDLANNLKAIRTHVEAQTVAKRLSSE